MLEKSIIPPRQPELRNALSSGCDGWRSLIRKVEQSAARYGVQQKGKQNCRSCARFIPGSNACTLVDGQINPEGSCIFA